MSQLIQLDSWESFSGKQGHAIARALSERGVKVTLISGPVNEETPKNVTFFPVNTAIEMLNACEAALPADIAICAAAVGDWRLQKQHESKLKKPSNPSEGMSLQLVQNPDILAKLSNRDRPKIVVGFSAETSDIEKMRAKTPNKKCD